MENTNIELNGMEVFETPEIQNNESIIAGRGAAVAFSLGVIAVGAIIFGRKKAKKARNEHFAKVLEKEGYVVEKPLDVEVVDEDGDFDDEVE